MVKKIITTEFVNNAIKLNIEGSNLGEIAEIVGCNADNLSVAMRKQGHIIIRHKRIANNYKELPEKELTELFASGWSVKKLAEKFGVARNVIHARLIKNGIQPRNRSEGMFNRMAFTPIEERKQLVKNANNILRGKPKDREHSKQAAITRQINPKGRLIGFGENELKETLINIGFDVVSQLPFDIYNIDLVVNGSIAVEITSHSGNPFLIEKNAIKTKKLIDSGYSVLWITNAAKGKIIANLSNIITYFKTTCLDPSFIGQYRMIRCNVDSFIRTRNDRGHFTCIPTTIKPFIEERTYNL